MEGYVNELLEAVRHGSTESTVALLSIGSIDINSVVDTKGRTLLMHAAVWGYSAIARILLNKGASTSIVGYGGTSVLHLSAAGGHLAVTKMLIEAGADVEARTSSGGFTPLHMATMRGHVEVMGALIEAGGNPNRRDLGGITVLHTAVSEGDVDAVKILLRAEASPLLAIAVEGGNYVPLDTAASDGHSGVVRELLQRLGIEGCGGASAGVDALELAVQNQHMDIMAMLTEAGVVDTGAALNTAARLGQETSVKFLLQQQEEKWKTSGEDAYANAPDLDGRTPLIYGICSVCFSSARIVRLLVDAGAGTSSSILQLKDTGEVVFNDTPLALTTRIIGERQVQGKCATEKQLHSLEATRRLLLQVEAVHAVSWLWPSDVPACIAHAVESRIGSKMTSTLLTLMFPILRRRARTRGVLLAALFRHSGKA